jgi:pimeloyl-ACP methyl ester carboxylesterase
MLRDGMGFDKMFSANKVALHYMEGPANGPPLVLLHGGGNHWKTFTPIITCFSADWHVHALDLRGHGQSGRVAGAYRIVDYLEDVLAFVRDCLTQPAVLWGQSLGANITLAVGAALPHHVRALILEEPRLTFAAPPESEVVFFNRLRNLTGKGLTVDAMMAELAEVCIPVPDQDEVRFGDVRSEADIRAFAESLSLLDPDVIILAHDPSINDLHDPFALLQLVPCPVLLALGAPERGSIVSEEDSKRAMGLLKKGYLVKFPEAGHNVHRSHPEAIQTTVKQFLSL